MPAEDFIDQMLRHRSIRRFTADPVPDADIRRAVEAGQAASTSSAVQAYCLIRIRDQQRRRSLIELTGGQKKVAASGAFFVICGDTRRHRLCCDHAGTPYDAMLEAFLLAVIDATLFAQNLVLAFESMGYGICYIGGLRNDLPRVQELLDFPRGIYPFYGLCVGKPAEQPLPRPRLPLDAVLMDDHYADDDTMTRLIAQYDRDYVEYLAQRGVEPESRQPWSDIMARQFTAPARTTAAAYYHSQGADLR